MLTKGEESTLLRLQVYMMVGISQVKIRKDAPYGLISWFTRHYMTISILGIYSLYKPVMKVCERDTFSVNLVFKMARGWTLGRSLPL